MINIFINFKTRNEPWGGINSFTKALKYKLSQRNDIKLLDEMDFSNMDIFFQGAATNGEIDLDENYFKGILSQRKKRRFKIVLRLDGLRAVYSTKVQNDDTQIFLSTIADHIVFQSKASLENFKKFGYNKDNYRIIYNGVNQEIFYPDESHKVGNKLKILAASWSSASQKGFGVTAQFSKLKNVEVTFVGRWNEEINKENVKVIEAVPQEDLAKIYRENDVFLHAAENDPCPNVVLEALSSGLPIIYNTSGGTPELAKGYGEPLEGNSLEDYSVIVDKIMNNYKSLRDKILNDMEKFSIDHVVKQYLNYFAEITENNSKNIRPLSRIKAFLSSWK